MQVSNKDNKKSVGYVGREDMSEYIQKGYMRIADIPELYVMFNKSEEAIT